MKSVKPRQQILFQENFDGKLPQEVAGKLLDLLEQLIAAVVQTPGGVKVDEQDHE